MKVCVLLAKNLFANEGYLRAKDTQNLIWNLEAVELTWHSRKVHSNKIHNYILLMLFKRFSFNSHIALPPTLSVMETLNFHCCIWERPLFLLPLRDFCHLWLSLSWVSSNFQLLLWSCEANCHCTRDKLVSTTFCHICGPPKQHLMQQVDRPYCFDQGLGLKSHSSNLPSWKICSRKEGDIVSLLRHF